VNKSLAPSFEKQATNEGCSAIHAEVPMCDKCVELDKKIEHYRSMASRIDDRPLLDGIAGLIQQMQDKKLALHPEQAK
jgi:hypothetical protein